MGCGRAFAECRSVDDSAPVTSPLTAFTRPYLRPDVPLIWIADDTVRFGTGTDGPRARCTPSQVAWLASLDGTGPGGATTEVGDGSDPRPLLAAAIAAGAIDDAARIPRAWRWLSPQRRWTLEPSLLAACHTYGNDLARDVMDRRLAAVVHVPGQQGLARAVRELAQQAGLEVSEQGPGACSVLAGGVAPADVDASLAHALEGPHLPIRVYGSTAHIGPLIIPGETACLRCDDLRRTDRDPAWPSEQAQRTAHEARLRVRPEDALLVHAAAVQAVALIRAWVDGVSTSWRDRALTVTLPSLALTSETVARHPLCGCWWPTT